MSPARGLRAAPPVQPLAPLRLVIVQDGDELLGSEQRALAQIERALGARFDLVRKPASEAEAAFLRSCMRAACEGSLLGRDAPLLSAHGAVLVLRIAPYLPGDKGKRVSRGLADVLWFAPAARTPLFQTSVDDDAAASLANSQLGPHLADLAQSLMGA